MILSESINKMVNEIYGLHGDNNADFLALAHMCDANGKHDKAKDIRNQVNSDLGFDKGEGDVDALVKAGNVSRFKAQDATRKMKKAAFDKSLLGKLKKKLNN